MAAPSVLAMLLIVTIFFFTSCLVLYKTDQVQNDPYMDEIFHVPQAQLFCNGTFDKWDPMITTLPGLYLLTSGLYHPIAWLLNLDPLQVCSVFNLRAINLMFNTGNLYLIYKLYRRIHIYDQISSTKALVESVSILTFPVLYFYTFLYYTDPGAVFCVLLMYLLHLHGNNIMAAILGALSVVFRQTNIVWVVFVAGQVIGKNLLEKIKLNKKDTIPEKFGEWSTLKLTYQVIVRPVITSPAKLVSLFFSLIKDVWMYVVVGSVFVLFVYINEGLVVGDRSHHQACTNFPQLFYLLSCTLFFAFPLLISVHKVFDFVVSTARNPIPMILFSGVAWFWVYKFTYVHQYLLADNRHYPFYVWSKIYRRHEFVRYALIPIYYYSLWICYQVLKAKDVFWKIVFLICLFVATIPQKLLEFRYFIIPFIIFRLNMPVYSNYKCLMMLSFYILINAFTLYMYIYKPFKWEHEEGWQRFLW